MSIALLGNEYVMTYDDDSLEDANENEQASAIKVNTLHVCLLSPQKYLALLHNIILHLLIIYSGNIQKTSKEQTSKPARPLLKMSFTVGIV